MADDLRASVFEAAGWGWIGLVASERGLRLLTLPQPDEGAARADVKQHYPDAAEAPDDPLLRAAADQVAAYLAGERREFDVALDLRGHTAFALSVWAIAGRIGYGETRTYGWIAHQLGGRGGIYQAVGAALGSNPVPLIVPCHRVIGADGSLHGYAGGLEMKRRLLALEAGQGQLNGL